MVLVAAVLLGGDRLDQRLLVGDAPVEALRRQDADSQGQSPAAAGGAENHRAFLLDFGWFKLQGRGVLSS
jgi:hypothetical protein